MNQHRTLKTIRSFYCPKVNAGVHIKYCTELRYQCGKASDTRERLIEPDCEQKDRCGIASNQDQETIYDWSACAHPELQAAHWHRENKKKTTVNSVLANS